MKLPPSWVVGDQPASDLLSWSDAELEQRFGSETDAQRDRQICLWTACGLCFFWITFGFDLVIMPDIWRLAFLLRLGVVTPVALAAIWVLAGTGPRWQRSRWQRSLASIVPPAVSVTMLTVLFSLSLHPDTLRSILAMSIGLLWINVVVPMRPRDALVFTIGTLAANDPIIFGTAWLLHLPIAYPETVIVMHMLVGLSLLSRLLSERQSRRSFLLGLRLQARADELARANAQLLQMSTTDPLTGLRNRRSFELALAHTHREAAALGTGLAVLMIDVDHFKSFNDTAGHLEGDRCLTTIARTIGEQVRGGQDLAARFGGEEFVVLMPGASRAMAQDVAARVHTAVSALRLHHPGHAGTGFVSVSIGVAAVEDGRLVSTGAELVAAADEALYAAKRGGRDRVTCTDPPVIAAS